MSLDERRKENDKNAENCACALLNGIRVAYIGILCLDKRKYPWQRA
jgi:hypothetical protein